MNKPWMAVTAAMLLASPGAWAAGAGGVGEGDIEAGLSVSLVSTEIEYAGSTTDSDVGLIEISGGLFINDQLEGKAALSAVETTDSTAGTLKIGADYLFTGPNATEMVPFAGAALGLGMFDTETDFLDIHGGIKYFFRERTSIEAKLSFLSPTDSAYDTATDLTVGINIYF